MDANTTTKRIRINLSQTAKGYCQFDITSEAETIEEVQKQLNDAIITARKVIKDNGLLEVGTTNNF